MRPEDIPEPSTRPAATAAISGVPVGAGLFCGTIAIVSHATTSPAIIQRSPEVEELRRPLRVPAQIVLAHPLDTHRVTKFAGDQRRLKSNVIISVAAIAARTILVDQTQPCDVQAQKLCNGLA